MEQEPVRETKGELVKALHEARKTFGPYHLNTAHALKDLARYLSAQHLDKPQHKAAEPLCRRMVEIIERNCGDDSMEFSDAALLHAQLLSHTGQIEKAAAVVFQSWQVAVKILGEEHENTANKRFFFMDYIEQVEISGKKCTLNLAGKADSEISRSQMATTPENLHQSTDYPAINLYTAIWAIRAALGNRYSSLHSRDADEFLNFTGAHLIWHTSALEILLRETSLDNDCQNEIRECGFQESFLRFEGEFLTPKEAGILKAFRCLARNNTTTVTRVLKASLSHLEQQVALLNDPIMKNVKMLQELLGLSEADCAILNFCGQMLQGRDAHRLAAMISLQGFDDATRSLSAILGIDAQEMAFSLRSSSLMIEYRLIEVCRDSNDLEDLLVVPANIQDCLTEPHDNLEQMMLHFVSIAKATCLTAADYPHLDQDRLALGRFLNGSRDQKAQRINLMFYGEPGTGKTEFAKVLAREAGFNLYEVASADKLGGSLNRIERLASLRISLRFLASVKNSLLLFDEIEDIFPNATNSFELSSRRNPTSYGKAWMNHLLENNPVPVIWISNEIAQIDHAYLRRFSYHLEFRKPPLRVRQRIAEKYLQSTSVSREFIGQIAQMSALTPALIESAARVVSLSCVDDSKEAECLVSKVIQQSRNAMGMKVNSDCRISPTGYHLDYLNVDSRHPIEQIAKSLKLNPSATMCFYGLPGTGKTALAEHLAGELDRPLLAKRASDIISMWVGESEKNIAKMFREAESEGAILFLDEADSFLRNRETATKGWEVSQVNELLQQMEIFKGIFICATNLFSDLDAAALRRFTFKISFKAMTPAQREKMFVQEALLGDAIMLDEARRRRLHRLDSLVPGDFAVVKRQSRMMGAIPTPDDFLAELESECALKPNKQSRKIGFTA